MDHIYDIFGWFFRCYLVIIQVDDIYDIFGWVFRCYLVIIHVSVCLSVYCASTATSSGNGLKFWCSSLFGCFVCFLRFFASSLLCCWALSSYLVRLFVIFFCVLFVCFFVAAVVAAFFGLISFLGLSVVFYCSFCFLFKLCVCLFVCLFREELLRRSSGRTEAFFWWPEFQVASFYGE